MPMLECKEKHKCCDNNKPVKNSETAIYEAHL